MRSDRAILLTAAIVTIALAVFANIGLDHLTYAAGWHDDAQFAAGAILSGVMGFVAGVMAGRA